MAGTRTAPTVDGTPTYKQVSLHFMDYQGKKRSVAINVDAATTEAQVEAYAAAAQVLSNATLYDISIADKYDSNEDSSNASEEVWNSVKDSLVTQCKEPTGNSKRGFIPAVIDDVFIETTTSIDPTNTDLGNYYSALLALCPAGYEVIGSRFTQRRQINEQVKV